ncbi:Zinc finger MYM-type protein 1 [Acipenser ruthenus]|uniref:Zinc finger MYM-type protein 1 n=1 Tax=Acipenser ruthenus TaxID=7906 RepID=A0A444V7M3_ACIRT|nr:Zinc finger MYM-type protein 1 [Acipenser ruthenus]
MLYNFFSGSVIHKLFVEKQQELEPTKRVVELKRLSDTRWASQYSTLWAIKRALPAISATLADVSDQSNAHRATEAKSLIGLIDGQFVLHVTMLESIFSLTKTLSDHLQATDLELASATDLVCSAVDTLNEKRNVETWNAIWECASDQCASVGIEMQRPQMRRKAQPRHLQEFVVNSQTGSRERLETSDDSRKHCFIYKLVCISMTLPVTSAACERSLSCLRRLKTYLRNRSGDARTSNLGVLAISSRRTKELDINAVIDRFAANHNNRRIVLL